MKVLYLIDTLEIGGTEQSILEIARHLTSTTALLGHVYTGDTLRRAYDAAGIPVIGLGINSNYGFARAISAVRRLIHDHKPDLLHVNLFRAGVIGRLAGWLERTPVIDSFVSDSYGQGRVKGLPLKRRAKLSAVRLADAMTARLVTHFVSNSNAVARSNASVLGVDYSRITVIHRGRDPRHYERASVVPSVLHDAEGYPLAGPILLNVGRLVESKGQADLLRAFTIVCDRFPSAHLMIAGEGPFRAELAKLSVDLGIEGKVSFLGQRSDIPGLLAAADVFVFPSHVEGHSGALIEAMFSGIPVVATDIPENRESVEHHKTALLVPPRNSDVLAETVLTMLDQPHDAVRMAANARQVAMERFDIRLIAKQYEELYRYVIDENTHRQRRTA